MMKKGFTIVELLMVVGIIAVLMGVVTTAASKSVQAGRAKRRDALCSMVQAGLAAYYAQNEDWPGSLGARVRNGNLSRTNKEGEDGKNDPNLFVLEGAEVREMVKALVDETKKGNPLVDVSGLFVSRSSGEPGDKGYGLDFMSAVRGTKNSKRKMTTNEMYFGYPDPSTGRFRRFKMVYSIPADTLTVKAQ